MIETILAVVISLAVGCWLGWSSCNSRWIDAAKHCEAIQQHGELYYVSHVKKWVGK